jgi:hypothetical protein
MLHVACCMLHAACCMLYAACCQALRSFYNKYYMLLWITVMSTLIMLQHSLLETERREGKLRSVSTVLWYNGVHRRGEIPTAKLTNLYFFLYIHIFIRFRMVEEQVTAISAAGTSNSNISCRKACRKWDFGMVSNGELGIMIGDNNGEETGWTYQYSDRRRDNYGIWKESLEILMKLLCWTETRNVR